MQMIELLAGCFDDDDDNDRNGGKQKLFFGGRQGVVRGVDD